MLPFREQDTWKKLELLSSSFLEEIFGFSMYSEAKYSSVNLVFCMFCALKCNCFENKTLLCDVKKQMCVQWFKFFFFLRKCLYIIKWFNVL